MKIVIIGDGKVGHTLARQLSEENHDIVLVDNKSAKLKETINELDVNCVEGDGVSQQVLTQAGVKEAELVAACTGSDSKNMLCCLLAKKLGAQRTIARVRNPVYHQELYLIKEDLGLSMAINPEYEAAEDISRILIFPSATKIETFAKGRVELVEFKIEEDSSMADMSLEELSHKYPGKVLICAVQRNQKVYIPGGNFVLKAGDKINIAASHKEVEKFLKLTGKLKKKINTILIAGGGRVAYYLAQKLTMVGMHIKIIERDKVRCHELCDLLPKATIIHADATNHELLLEEGIEKADAFISLTGMDEENVIMSLFAKTKKVLKIITKVNSEYLTNMIDELGIESVVSPKMVTADIIVSYVRARQNSMKSSNIETVYSLVNDQIEALEFLIKEQTFYTGVAIKDMKFKDDILVACIVRNRAIIIPNGDDMLKVGDTVIVISKNEHFHNFDEIMRV